MSNLETGAGEQSPAPQRPQRPRRKRRRGAVALITALALLLTVGGGAAFALWYVQRQVDAKIERIDDPFEQVSNRPTPRPSPTSSDAPVAPTEPVNILVLGSDSRISAGDPSQWSYGAQRSDSIMLIHIPGDRSGAYVMSFQRDFWVDIPGYGPDKINAAFSYGGPALLIETIESLTGLYINHFAVADFESFAAITDAVGGVSIYVPEDTYAGQGQIKLAAGQHQMDGATALAYARERYNLPNGDFDRMRRQQNWMRAIASQVMNRDTLTNPLRLNEFLQVAAAGVAVDEGFTMNEMRDLALSMRSVRKDDLVFMLAPVAGTGRERNDTAWVAYLDDEYLREIGQAMAEDRFGQFVAEHRDRLDVLDTQVS